MSLQIAIALLAALQPLSARDCENAMAQAEMTACAGQDFERADAELNALWRTTIAHAQSNDRSPDAGRTEYDQRSEETILRAGQRAWIALRDAQCEWEGMSERGGSLEPMIVNQCLARMTRARIAQLRGEDAGGQ